MFLHFLLGWFLVLFSRILQRPVFFPNKKLFHYVSLLFFFNLLFEGHSGDTPAPSNPEDRDGTHLRGGSAALPPFRRGEARLLDLDGGEWVGSFGGFLLFGFLFHVSKHVFFLGEAYETEVLRDQRNIQSSAINSWYSNRSLERSN